MKRSSIPSIVAALSMAVQVSASEAIYLYQGVGNIVGYANGWAGFAFQPTTTLSVTSLGFGGDSLATEPYQVTLWDSAGASLASATVSTASTFQNQTYYQTITPITLTAGQTYYIGGTGINSGYWVGHAMILPPDPLSNGTISVSPDVTYLGGALGGAGSGIPTSVESIAFYINANFQYTVVPEPGAVVLIGLAAFGACAWRQVKSA